MRQTKIAVLFSTIMLIGYCLVNASQPKRNSKSIERLVTDLQKNGRIDTLADRVGPTLDLENKAPIRYFALKPNPPYWTKKFIDLILTQNGQEQKTKPLCIVIIEHRKTGKNVFVSDYRFDLDGNLQKGYVMEGRDDEEGKPIPGSATFHQFDLTDKDTLKRAHQELDFWLSGKYRKFLSN
jgi:hypothetical protein